MFYEILKQACTERGTTPSAACVAAGMSKASVTDWKKGSIPRVDTVVRLARQIGMDELELLRRCLKAMRNEQSA